MNSETAILVALVVALMILAAVYGVASSGVKGAGNSYEDGILQNASSESFFQTSISMPEQNQKPVESSREVEEWQTV